eukprot:17675_1
MTKKLVHIKNHLHPSTMTQTLPNMNFVDDTQVYYASKIKLEQARNLQDLLPFIESLLSIHDIKLLLHKALDIIKDDYIDKAHESTMTNHVQHPDQLKTTKANHNIRSVYMSIGSIDELLPNDVLINILSYLNIDHEYAKLPVVSK